MQAIEWTPKLNHSMVTQMQSPVDALRGARSVDENEFVRFGLDSLPEGYLTCRSRRPCLLIGLLVREGEEEFADIVQAYTPVAEAIKDEVHARWRVATELWNFMVNKGQVNTGTSVLPKEADVGIGGA